jgi:hypothetical protein
MAHYQDGYDAIVIIDAVEDAVGANAKPVFLSPTEFLGPPGSGIIF